MFKRFILGAFAAGADPVSRVARAARFSSGFMRDRSTVKAVYTEPVAKGPRGDSFVFDFLVEVWTDDGRAAFDAERAAALAAEFDLDLSRSRTALADEKIIKPGSAAVKGTFLSKRRPDSTVQEYLRYWRHEHADIIQAQTDFFSYVRAYVQNHFIPGSFVTLAGEPLSQADAFDGSPQMWFDTPDDIYRAFATDGYHKHIKEDEKILVKVGYSQSIIGAETSISL